MNVENRITKIEPCEQNLSSRGGLALILRYLEKIGVLDLFEKNMGHLRKSKKGMPISEIAKQILANFIDGTSTSISSFDDQRDDPAQSSLFEVPINRLVGRDIVSRFFDKIHQARFQLFRSILRKLFLWRLSIEKPKQIILDLDTMVLDNDDAKIREGCNVTYKKKKGFQPLQLCWGNLIVDSLFRSGEKHSNYSDNVQSIVKKAVYFIRENYDETIPIILTTDSGFLDEKNFLFFENTLKIKYICMGKLYKTITTAVTAVPPCDFKSFSDKSGLYYFHEFESKLDSWKNMRRTIYSAKANCDNQLLLEFARPESVIYTNIEDLSAQEIIALAHGRGASELNNRSLKEFIGTEHLPFKNFGSNGGWYYMKVIGHFLLECYRKDVACTIFPKRCYPNTLRRKLIDFAVKIIRHSHETIIKVSKITFEKLNLSALWKACNYPIPI